jgi:hypothetical protein
VPPSPPTVGGKGNFHWCGGGGGGSVEMDWGIFLFYLLRVGEIFIFYFLCVPTG